MFLELVLQGVGHTWLPSLPKWGIKVMGQPTLRAILLPANVRLESRVLGLRMLFLVGLPSLSLVESLPAGPICCLV
jgi:hypothetical protein